MRDDIIDMTNCLENLMDVGVHLTWSCNFHNYHPSYLLYRWKVGKAGIVNRKSLKMTPHFLSSITTNISILTRLWKFTMETFCNILCKYNWRLQRKRFCVWSNFCGNCNHSLFTICGIKLNSLKRHHNLTTAFGKNFFINEYTSQWCCNWIACKQM